MITPERFPNDISIKTKVGYIAKALEQYLNKTTKVFCKNQCTNDTQGVCQPLQAYGYGHCSCLKGFSGDDCSHPPPTTTQIPHVSTTTPVPSPTVPTAPPTAPIPDLG